MRTPKNAHKLYACYFIWLSRSQIIISITAFSVFYMFCCCCFVLRRLSAESIIDIVPSNCQHPTNLASYYIYCLLFICVIVYGFLFCIFIEKCSAVHFKSHPAEFTLHFGRMLIKCIWKLLCSMPKELQPNKVFTDKRPPIRQSTTNTDLISY